MAKRTCALLLIRVAASCLFLQWTFPVDSRAEAESGDKDSGTQVKLYGHVDELTDLCSQIGITLSSKEAPALISRVEDNSLAERANLGRGDKILSAHATGSKIVLEIERDGRSYKAEIETRPGLQNEVPMVQGTAENQMLNGNAKRSGINGGINQTGLQGGVHQPQLQGGLASTRQLFQFDGVGGPGGSGGPGVVGHTDAPGWPGKPGGSGGRGEIIAGADGVSGPSYADNAPPIEPNFQQGGGRSGREGRPGQNGPGEAVNPGGLGEPGLDQNGGEGIHGLSDFDFSPRAMTGYNPAEDWELRVLPTPVLGPGKRPIMSANHKLNPLRVTLELGGSYIRSSFNGARVKRLLLDRLADRAAQVINSYKWPAGAVRGVIVIDKEPYQRELKITSAFNGASAETFFGQTAVRVTHVESDTNKARVEQLLDKQKLLLSPVIAEIHSAESESEDSCNNGAQNSLANLLSYNGNVFSNTAVDWSVHSAHSSGASGSLLRPTQLQIAMEGPMSGHCFDTQMPYIHWNRPDFDIQHLDAAPAMSQLNSQEYPGDIPKPARRAAFAQYRDDRKRLISAIRNEGRFETTRFIEDQRNGSRTVAVRLQTVPAQKAQGLSRPVLVRFSMGSSRLYRSFNQNGSLTALVNEFLDRLSKEVKPSRLYAIDHIIFRMEGATIENSFNDNP